MRAIKLKPRNEDEVKRVHKRRKQHSWNSWTHLKFVEKRDGRGNEEVPEMNPQRLKGPEQRDTCVPWRPA